MPCPKYPRRHLSHWRTRHAVPLQVDVAISHLSSVICHLSSVICYLLSVLCYKFYQVLSQMLRWEFGISLLSSSPLSTVSLELELNSGSDVLHIVVFSVIS